MENGSKLQGALFIQGIKFMNLYFASQTVFNHALPPGDCYAGCRSHSFN